MYKFFPLLLGVMDTLNDWNEKLNNFVGNHMNNVAVGTAIVGIIFVVSVWGVNTLNKK